jgi:type I restriction-modification system DNA methylase subunit
MKEAARMLGVSSIIDFHIEARVDGGTADLYAEEPGKRLVVLEAKFKEKSGKVEYDVEPRDPGVIKQAVGYAVNGGFPFYMTCNTKRLILFQLQPGKKPLESEIASFEFEEDTSWAEEVLKIALGQVPIRLKPLDDTLVDTLHEAFSDLYPEFLSSLQERLKDRAFKKKYEEWLEDQGLRPDEETNRLIVEQSTYLQLNKLLFYQVIRTIYPDRLDELKVEADEDVSEALSRFYEQAKKIDYAPIYESDVISEIPLTARAKERFRTLIDTLKEFDFSSMRSDFLGRVYEKLIPPDERKKLGQFYTPPEIVNLIVALTIRDKDQTILDPGCGSGSFLVAVYHRLRELKGFGEVSGPLYEAEHKKILSQTYGIDINQFPAHLSVINLVVQNPAVKVDRINVVVKDFFDIKAGQETLSGFEGITTEGERTAIKMPGSFNTIIANPPYIRQEVLGAKEKKKIIELVEKEFPRLYIGNPPPKSGRDRDAVVLDKQSDIYVYFFLHGLALLRDGGTLGFITSNKWLEVGYGGPFQEFLLKNVKVKYIIEFDRAIFPDAEVNTAISILEKEKSEQARSENDVRFVRLKQRMSIEETLKSLTMAEESYEDEKIRVNVVRQGSLKPGKWNVYLRAPPVYRKIVSHPKMKPLGEIAKVFRGPTTGYNDYFILDEEKVREWGIEKEFLVPCVSSPKKVKGLIIRPEDVKEYFFMVGEDQEVPKDSNAYKYIEYGEKLEVEVARGSQRGKRRFPELETVKNRKRWYSLPKFEAPSLLVPRLQDVRLFAFYNYAQAQASHLFCYVTPPLSPKAAAAFLNSSIGSLMAELYGRSYGGGVLDVETYEMKQIPVMNPVLLGTEERETLTKSFNHLEESVRERIRLEEEYERVKSKSKANRGVLEYELEQKLEEARRRELEAQKELDEAVYDILGLSKVERKQVEDGLKKSQEMRRQRTRA